MSFSPKKALSICCFVPFLIIASSASNAVAISFSSHQHSSESASQRLPSTYTPESTYLKLKDRYSNLSVADQKIPANIKLTKDIVYDPFIADAGLFDVYAPLSENNSLLLPAIILVHGGGWNTGSKENMSALAVGLAKRGYVAIAINYRLAYEAKYPAAIHDVKLAAAFILNNAHRWNIDTEKLSILGGSAGGQIASLVGVTRENAIVPPEFSAKIKFSAVIDLDGVLDFTDPEALKTEDDPAKKTTAAGTWFGGRFSEVPHFWKEASPVYYLDETAPPFFVVRSGEPRFSVGYRRLASTLNAKNIPVKIHTLESAPHAYWLLNLWLDETVGLIDEFLISLNSSPH